MEAKISEKEGSYLIRVDTDKEIAIAVRSTQGERIYLPGEGGSDTTYYNEDPTFLTSTENGYAVVHDERPNEVEVIS